MILINNKKKKKPFVSIITPTYNSEKYLEEMLKSLLKQKYKNFEVIIIDAASKDKTLNIIKKYKKIINYCSSKRDKGIYDGFNKGIKQAKGKYIVIINSDDILKPNALEYLKKYDDKNPKIDFLFGSVKKHWGVLHGYKPNKIYYSWGFYSSHSTGFYIKKKSADKVGLYNLKYKYHADYDYFYRMIVKHKMIGISSKKNELFGVFRRGGFSSSISFKKKFFEEIQIRIDHEQNIFLIMIIFIYKFLKNFRVFFKK
jgi:glycosyltransferase involved in cell wall biosynthesis